MVKHVHIHFHDDDEEQKRDEKGQFAATAHAKHAELKKAHAEAKADHSDKMTQHKYVTRNDPNAFGAKESEAKYLAAISKEAHTKLALEQHLEEMKKHGIKPEKAPPKEIKKKSNFGHFNHR